MTCHDFGIIKRGICCCYVVKYGDGKMAMQTTEHMIQYYGWESCPANCEFSPKEKVKRLANDG